MYSLRYKTSYKKDIRKIKKTISNKLKQELESVLFYLQQAKKLDIKYKNHKLKGNYGNCMECHIAPDLLLIYETNKEEKTITLIRLGSHSELFK